MEEEQRESRELFSSFTLGLLPYTCARAHTLNTHTVTLIQTLVAMNQSERLHRVRGVKHPDKWKFKYGHCISFIYPKISSGSLCMCLMFYCPSNKIVCHDVREFTCLSVTQRCKVLSL